MGTLKDFAPSIKTELPFEKAIKAVTEALMKEGFGILTEINVKHTLKVKIDADFQNYVILGACNPPSAFKALSMDPRVGVLLPCNVVVRDDGNARVISYMEPAVISMLIEIPDMKTLAEDISVRLGRVLKEVASL